MNDELQSLRLQVEQLGAENAIRSLKARYWRAIDRHDLATVRECLLPNALIDMEGVGAMQAEEFIAFVQENGCNENLLNLHTGQNPLIKLESTDRAVGEWDALFTSINMATRETILMSGNYQDRYQKQDNEWRIAAMTFRQTSFLMQQYNDKGEPKAISLGRGNEDAFGRQ